MNAEPALRADVNSLTERQIEEKAETRSNPSAPPAPPSARRFSARTWWSRRRW